MTTTQQCAALLRLVLFMALAVGFFGFLAGAPGAGGATHPAQAVQLSLSQH